MLFKAEEIIKCGGKILKIVDLGCGSGSLLIPLAKKFPQHHFYGYEWDMFPYFLANWRIKRLKNLTIYRQDFMKENLEKFDLILCNIGVGLENCLGQKLNREISEDAVVLSEIFRLSALKQEEVFSSKICGIKTNIFLYRKNSSST